MTSAEVKKAREAMGLTQSELADLLGVARNSVARWEMGMHPISTPVERLLRTLAASKATPRPSKLR
jgi:DNA-binding transcriptional regulator YiaG